MTIRGITVLVLLALLFFSNLAWMHEYRKLWEDTAQAEGLLDEAEHYIRGRQRPDYIAVQEPIRLKCVNGGDPTGSTDNDLVLTVSCGE